MKRERSLRFFTIMPLISEIIALIFLPNQIPVHYNMSFQATEYGSKYILLMLGVFVVFFGLFMNWIYRMNVNTGHEKIVYRLSLIALIVFNAINLFALYGSFFVKDSYVGMSIISVIALLCGVIFVFKKKKEK